MTLKQLAEVVTQEELIGWAAYFEVKAEYEEKAMERSRRNSQAATMRSR
jgi:hypothetical protein